MRETIERPVWSERAELREWYLRGLRPKLAHAASAGTVAATSAAALDALLCDLLEMAGDEADAVFTRRAAAATGPRR